MSIVTIDIADHADIFIGALETSQIQKSMLTCVPVQDREKSKRKRVPTTSTSETAQPSAPPSGEEPTSPDKKVRMSMESKAAAYIEGKTKNSLYPHELLAAGDDDTNVGRKET